MQQVLDDSHIHSVNLAEVSRKLVDKGMPVAEVEGSLRELNLDVIEEFSQAQAYAVSTWSDKARRLGLSPGDCVCLTVAQWGGLIAVTADKRWSELDDLKIQIVQIR